MSKSPSYFIEPRTPADLYQKILWRLELEAEKKERRARFGLAVFFFVVAVVILIPASLNLQNQIYTSGLLQFLSLIFSDFSQVTIHYQSFLYSILESFPFFASAFVFLGLLLLLESIRIFTKKSKKFFLSGFNQ